MRAFEAETNARNVLICLSYLTQLMLCLFLSVFFRGVWRLGGGGGNYLFLWSYFLFVPYCVLSDWITVHHSTSLCLPPFAFVLRNGYCMFCSFVSIRTRRLSGVLKTSTRMFTQNFWSLEKLWTSRCFECLQSILFLHLSTLIYKWPRWFELIFYFLKIPSIYKSWFCLTSLFLWEGFLEIS